MPFSVPEALFTTTGMQAIKLVLDVPMGSTTAASPERILAQARDLGITGKTLDFQPFVGLLGRGRRGAAAALGRSVSGQRDHHRARSRLAGRGPRLALQGAQDPRAELLEDSPNVGGCIDDVEVVFLGQPVELLQLLGLIIAETLIHIL